MSARRLLAVLSLTIAAPALACGGGDDPANPVPLDAGSDAAKDGGADAPKDAPSEASKEGGGP